MPHQGPQPRGLSVAAPRVRPRAGPLEDARSSVKRFQPLAKVGVFRLTPVLDDLLGGAAGSLASAGCGCADRAYFRLRQRSEVEPCVSDAEFSRRRLSLLQVLDGDAELVCRGGRESVRLAANEREPRRGSRFLSVGGVRTPPARRAKTCR